MLNSFNCPRCRATSYNPHDIREGYCGGCHDWTGSPKISFYCDAIGPRTCREPSKGLPEHELCRDERICNLERDHEGEHSWEWELKW